jgi:hypothetical protein
VTGDRDRWNEQWARVPPGHGGRSGVVELVEPWLPTSGRGLDVAGGGADDAIELARRGLEMTVVDVSDVGLGRARDRAAAAGVSVTTVEADLEREPLPAGPWQLITVANYLQRDLFAVMAGSLAPGGVLAAVICTTVNLEHHERPGRRFLLDPGELPTLVPGLTVVHHSEGWRDGGRHEAHLVARRDDSSPGGNPPIIVG